MTSSLDSAALRDTAITAADRGWQLFPLRPGDKRPAVRDWESRATCDPARIRRCWETGAYNIGIACGPSRLVVVDLDNPKPGAEPPQEWRLPGVRSGVDVLAILAERAGAEPPLGTYSVRTGSGGEHLYFTVPAGADFRNTAGKLGWLVDTRAAGGYVVAAGSVVDGHPYEVLDDTEPARLPEWLASALADRDSREPATGLAELQAAVRRRSAYAAAALRNELERVLAAREGSRNHTLNAAAYALGRLVASRLIPAQLAEEALLQASREIGLGAHEAEATIRSGLSAGARRPYAA